MGVHDHRQADSGAPRDATEDKNRGTSLGASPAHGDPWTEPTPRTREARPCSASPGETRTRAAGKPSDTPFLDRAKAFGHALGEGLAEFLWPARCVGCDRPGTLLCDECDAELPRIEAQWACPRCGAPFGYLVCTQCDETWTEIPRIVSALSYEATARELVKVYKDAHERRLAAVLAALLAEALENSGVLPELRATVDALAFIPSTNEAYNRRGFDPMEGVAAELSPLLHLPVADVLAHRDVRDQRELDARERRTNVEGSFVVVEEVEGRRLLLIDDVITTGASVRAAARALAAHGATVLLCASVCRVW